MTLEDEMREWLLECFTSEDDQEEIESLGFEELYMAIGRYYDGGNAQFYRDSATYAKHYKDEVEV